MCRGRNKKRCFVFFFLLELETTVVQQTKTQARVERQRGYLFID